MKLLHSVLIFSIVISVYGKDEKKKKILPFDSETVKCLVCQSVVDEYKFAVEKIDPNKMTESGTFRVDGDGVQAKTSVSLTLKN